MSALATSALTKRYGAATALEPIDVEIPAGQRVTLVGHNGSGKTTLLRLVSGLLDPSGGSARVAGHPAGSPAARAALSYLGDQPVFYDDLSLAEHVEYVARLNTVHDWQERGTELLGLLGLTGRSDDLPSAFSRGLRQKAAIALAFVRPFALLVVDEPFVGLDASGREVLLGLLAASHAGGAALLVATHELSTLGGSQRILALRDGSLVYDGTPEDLDAGDVAAP